MNTRNKWVSAGLLALLFVGTNFYLIKNDVDLIDRTSVVHDQKQAQQEDLQQLLVKNGVLVTATEQFVYFSEQLGMFTRFLVEEGQSVTVGTPLYEYTVLDLEEQRLLFESEAEQLSSEISSIDTYIDELTSIERQLSSNSSRSTSNASPTSSLDDEELLITIELEVGIDVSDATIDQTRSLLNQKIGEQESAVGRLEAEEEKYERLIEGLDDSPVVTVESEFDGKISHLSEQVDNPLVTIHTENLASKSMLTDGEAQKALAGMASRVTSSVANSTIDGAVVANPQLPEKTPELGSESLYPVDIDLIDQSSEWFIGQHVINEIVLDESVAATTVPTISLDQQRVYVLSSTGLIEPRIVDIGLRVDDRQELLTNVEPGEWIIVDPGQVERFYSSYLAPMTLKRLTFDNLDQLEPRDNWKHVLLGVLPH